ncbi:MAG: hypothetical protein OEO77_07875 [Acidimicrobiia bacterium]|nr:hypothetical protein [Acidimicrobiia bacterium]
MSVKFMGPDPGRAVSAVVEEVGAIMGMSEDEFAALAQSICIMVPHRPSGGISGGIAQANGLWARHGVSFAPVEDEFRGHIDIMRASMCRAFLQYCYDRPECKFMVMMDSDELVPWDAPYRLAAWDLPIVSGVVCSISEGRGIWACFTVKDKYGVARFPSFNYTNKLPGKGLVDAHSVGGGLVCIRKDVIQDLYDAGEIPFLIPDKVRREACEVGTLKFGEDTWFCEQARKIGHKCYVDMAVHAVHIKSTNISWPRSHVDYNMDPEDFEVDGREHHHG